MAEKVVIIYGKAGWPYTQAAREDYAKKGYKVDYRDAKENPEYLEELLKYSGGQRRVPVIVEGDKVTVGYGGTW